MDTGTLFQQPITKKQFFSDVDMAKKVVDSGFSGHFVLLNNSSFSKTRTIGGTTLSDIKDVYGGYPIYKDYRFAIPHYDFDEGKTMTSSSITIRDITKKDKARLRNAFKFFPPSTYIAECTDPDGFTLLIPFKQNPDGSTVLLQQCNIYRQSKASARVLEDVGKTVGESIWQTSERIIELFPDLMDSLLAVVKYKGVDMCIPIEKTSARKTFRTRDKDGERRAQLIHNVGNHSRVNLKKTDKVRSHIRGRSDFSIDGINVSLIATPEWSMRWATDNNKLRRIAINE